MPVMRRSVTSQVISALSEISGTAAEAVQVVPPDITISDPPDDAVVQSDMTDPETGGVVLPEGQVISLIDVDGVLTYVPAGCNADNYPEFFFGIVSQTTAQGEAATISVGRGSIVAPLVENDALLDTSKPVYLSTTAGRVTQDLDSLPNGDHVYRIGQAVSETQIVLNTDYREIRFG